MRILLLIILAVGLAQATRLSALAMDRDVEMAENRGVTESMSYQDARDSMTHQGSFDLMAYKGSSELMSYQGSMCKKALVPMSDEELSNVTASTWGDVAYALGEVTPADYVLVNKSKRQISLLRQGKVLKTYRMALGRSPEGKKRQEGDNKTPEGLYHIGYKNSASDFHLSLQIDYPNQDDINWARKNGVNPGGDIMVHGLPNSKWKRAFINHPKKDWTRGCVAVTNNEIEEIWGLVKTGTPIELCP